MFNHISSWSRQILKRFKGKSTDRMSPLNGVRTALRGVTDTLDGVPAPGLQGALRGILFILDNVERATQNLSDFEQLAKHLEDIDRLFRLYNAQDLPLALKEAINTLSKDIDESCLVINRIVEHCRARRIWESSDDAELFSRQVGILNRALARFLTATLSYTSVTVNESLEINRRLLLDRLPIERKAFYNSADRDNIASCCMDNTRSEMRKRINDWIFDENAPPIFWLRGMTGSGKSTIAQTIAERGHDEGFLAGHFFFSRDLLSRHAGGNFFTTLACQLCDFDAQLLPHVAETLQNNPSLSRASSEIQLAQLITRPLSMVDKVSAPLSFPAVVVMDGLDECHIPDDASELLHLLFNNSLLRDQRPILKFLITSRQALHIREAFDSVPEPKSQVFLEYNLDDENAEGDIELYLRHGLEQVRLARPECFRSRTTPWPEPESLNTLVDRSKGLFIQAATILKFIGDQHQHPVKQLRAVLNAGPGNNVEADIYSGLDRLYRQVLTQDPSVDRVRKVVATILLSNEPLSSRELELVLDLEEGEAHVTLQWLQAVLIIPSDEEEPILPVHPSLLEFITTKSRSGNLYVDPEEYREKLALARPRHSSQATRTLTIRRKDPTYCI